MRSSSRNILESSIVAWNASVSSLTIIIFFIFILRSEVSTSHLSLNWSIVVIIGWSIIRCSGFISSFWSSVWINSIRCSGSRGSLSSRSNLRVLGLGKSSRLCTVNIEPPVTDEVVLVEDGSIGAEEAVLGKTSSTISSADVECLTLSFWISIVTWWW